MPLSSFNTGTAFAWASRSLGNAVGRIGGNAWYNQASRVGLSWLSSGAAHMANSPYTRSAVLGGIAGGTYGAFSDNTSVLGGIGMGAGIGVGGRFAGRVGRDWWRAFAVNRGKGMGAGQAGWVATKLRAQDASRFLAAKYTMARNTMKGWKA